MRCREPSLHVTSLALLSARHVRTPTARTCSPHQAAQALHLAGALHLGANRDSPHKRTGNHIPIRILHPSPPYAAVVAHLDPMPPCVVHVLHVPDILVCLIWLAKNIELIRSLCAKEVVGWDPVQQRRTNRDALPLALRLGCRVSRRSRISCGECMSNQQ